MTPGALLKRRRFEYISQRAPKVPFHPSLTGSDFEDEMKKSSLRNGFAAAKSKARGRANGIGIATPESSEDDDDEDEIMAEVEEMKKSNNKLSRRNSGSNR